MTIPGFDSAQAAYDAQLPPYLEDEEDDCDDGTWSRAPRVPVAQYCDACQRMVTDPARIAFFADVMQVDWVLCRRCRS